MMKLTFKNAEEFNSLFSSNDRRITDGIVYGIRCAVENKNSTADLFELSFEGDVTAFELTLSSTQWEQALTTCIKKYEEQSLYDDAIDTYQLLKKIKNV